VKIPLDVRRRLEERVWKAADGLGWSRLSAVVKSQWYENWTASPDVGGMLRSYGDANQIRLYIKDALMKRYARSRRERPDEVLTRLGVESPVVNKLFIKPHGCLLADGRVICWGPARTWKLVVMSVFERATWEKGATPHAAALTQATALPDAAARQVVEAAAAKLGIVKVAWVDG